MQLQHRQLGVRKESWLLRRRRRKVPRRQEEEQAGENVDWREGRLEVRWREGRLEEGWSISVAA